MKRRDFLRSTVIASASLVFPNAGRLFVEGATSPRTLSKTGLMRLASSPQNSRLA